MSAIDALKRLEETGRRNAVVNEVLIRTAKQIVEAASPDVPWFNRTIKTREDAIILSKDVKAWFEHA